METQTASEMTARREDMLEATLAQLEVAVGLEVRSV